MKIVVSNTSPLMQKNKNKKVICFCNVKERKRTEKVRNRYQTKLFCRPLEHRLCVERVTKYGETQARVAMLVVNGC